MLNTDTDPQPNDPPDNTGGGGSTASPESIETEEADPPENSGGTPQ